MKEKSKTKVICDTNIWYKLSSNELTKPDSSKYSLICTQLSLDEIANSNNYISKLSEIKSACTSILQYADDYILV